jgi:D-glycero-alpha-D-manno-heptose-7-phosphate kinase
MIELASPRRLPVESAAPVGHERHHFCQSLGQLDMIITQTPLRISFLGGGTDYPEYFEKHGGAVLGTAVDKSAFFSMSHFYSEMFDYSVRIAYRRVECVSSLDEIEHAPFRECLRWAGVTQDIEINHSAELPAFTGLGSSSSFVVGLLNTVYAFRRRLVPRLDLAYEAIEIERKVLKESVGCQDQSFAAVGGFNVIEFHSMGNFVVHRIPLSNSRLEEFEDHLLIFFTGIKRRAEELSARQVHRIGENRQQLGEMRRLVDEGYAILAGGRELSGFGELLHKSWLLKRQLDRSISNDAIDEMYQAGREAGALGGKLLGAGGGGFLLFFVPPERRAAVELRLKHLPRVDFRVNAPGSQIIHCGTDWRMRGSFQHREAV